MESQCKDNIKELKENIEEEDRVTDEILEILQEGYGMSRSDIRKVARRLIVICDALEDINGD